jgi:hypothetical protein
MKYSKPNFKREWNEAIRYPEFEEMGKKGWLDIAQNNFEITNYEAIKDVLGNVNLDFDSLEEDKKERFDVAFEKGVVEIPIVVKFNENDYDLVGGNTRLAGLVKNGINPKLWVVKLDEETDSSNLLKGGNADNKSLIQIAKKHDAKGYYHIDNMVQSLKRQVVIGIPVEMEHTNDKNKAKEIVMDHLWEDPTYYTKLKKYNIKEEPAEDTKMDLNEKCWKGYTQKGMKTMFGKRYPNCVKKTKTNEASSPAQQAAIAIDMKKKGVSPQNESKQVGGNKKTISNLKGDQKDMVYGIIDIVKKVTDMGNRRKIADDMVKQFKKENIDFDYNEFLNMCGCNKKVEAKEMTGADSAGAFSAPAFGGKKTVVNKIHNMNEEQEIDEVTDASSSGSYDVPLFGGAKGRKNPLSIGGPDTIYKGRAVKDKKFPKWGGPGGKFVKIKDKCKKYPYCTQGDMSALELLESEEVKLAVQEAAKKYGLSTKEVNNLVLNQIKGIFI